MTTKKCRKEKDFLDFCTSKPYLDEYLFGFNLLALDAVRHETQMVADTL